MEGSPESLAAFALRLLADARAEGEAGFDDHDDIKIRKAAERAWKAACAATDAAMAARDPAQRVDHRPCRPLRVPRHARRRLKLAGVRLVCRPPSPALRARGAPAHARGLAETARGRRRLHRGAHEAGLTYPNVAIHRLQSAETSLSRRFTSWSVTANSSTIFFAKRTPIRL